MLIAVGNLVAGQGWQVGAVDIHVDGAHVANEIGDGARVILVIQGVIGLDGVGVGEIPLDFPPVVLRT